MVVFRSFTVGVELKLCLAATRHLVGFLSFIYINYLFNNKTYYIMLDAEMPCIDLLPRKVSIDKG